MNEIDHLLINGSAHRGLYEVYRIPINEIINLETLKTRKAEGKCDVSKITEQINDPFAQVYFSNYQKMQKQLRPVLKKHSLNQCLKNDHYVIIKNGKLVNNTLNKKNQAHYNNDQFPRKNTNLSKCKKKASKLPPKSDKTMKSNEISKGYIEGTEKSKDCIDYNNQNIVVRKSERIRNRINLQMPCLYVKKGYKEVSTIEKSINKSCIRNNNDISERENLFNSNKTMDNPQMMTKRRKESCLVNHRASEESSKGKLNKLKEVNNARKKKKQTNKKCSSLSRFDTQNNLTNCTIEQVTNIHQKPKKNKNAFVSEAKDAQICKKRKPLTSEENFDQKEQLNKKVKLQELPNKEVKRGTLKYFMQRQCHLKDSQINDEEMDFFHSSQKETNHDLYDLFEVDLNESLTIKTPKDKNKNCYSGLTPRSELLNELGNKIKLPTPVTPLQKSAESQKVATQLLFRHLNDKKPSKKRSRRPCSSKVNLNPTFKNFNEELPILPEEEREGDSSFDDYFNTS